MSQITINPYNKEILKVETQFCGRTLSMEINRVGFRSTSSVIVRYGDTVILGTAMISSGTASNLDYFPLSIEYEEKMYASGKISGSRFIKREGRPSDDAILIGRLIDRPIRPLWPKGYRNEVQAIATVLSTDPDFRPDSIAMIAISTALSLTGAPFDGPIAGIRVGKVDGKLMALPSLEQLENGDLDLVVAGTESAITMVEAGANEISEKEVIEALEFAHKAMQPAIALQKELIAKVGVVPMDYSVIGVAEGIQEAVDKFLKDKLGKKIRIDYPSRNEKLKEIKQSLMDHFLETDGEDVFTQNKSEKVSLKTKSDLMDVSLQKLGR